MPACHAGGRGFESRPFRNNFTCLVRQVEIIILKMHKLVVVVQLVRMFRFIGKVASLNFTLDKT